MRYFITHTNAQAQKGLIGQLCDYPINQWLRDLIASMLRHYLTQLLNYSSVSNMLLRMSVQVLAHPANEEAPVNIQVLSLTRMRGADTLTARSVCASGTLLNCHQMFTQSRLNNCLSA
jgi:hypothetical protein